MFFYLNCTLALFGYHHENEALAAISFLLGVPGEKENHLAMKLFYTMSPVIIGGKPCFLDHLRRTDEAAGGM